MNKDEILVKSRKENRNKDLPELEASYRAGAIAMRVGATVCVLLAVLSEVLADRMIYSPWIIYFSILGTHWTVRFVSLKKKSDLVMAAIFFILAILGAVFFVQRLVRGVV